VSAVDFNKEYLNLEEYINLVEHVLNKHCKRFKFEHRHAQEVIDDVVDYVMKYDKQYDSSNGTSRSTYRWMICLRRAIHVIKRIQRDENRTRDAIRDKMQRKPYIEEDYAHNYEVNRLNEIVWDIVERRKDDNIRFMCFYEHILQEKKGAVVAEELGISTTLVGYYCASAKKILKNELIHAYGADDWSQ